MAAAGAGILSGVTPSDLCDARFTRSWPAIPDAVADLRQSVVDYARGIGLADETLAALRLAVSEAATNVVLHAYADDPQPGPVHVRAEVDDGELRVYVSDDGCGMRPRPDSPGLGLGLPLIAQLAEAFVVESPPDGGTEICMRFPI
jgi:serine/threonine-protein kinase RsbW